MLSASGSALLFADADGATKFSDLQKLDDSLRKVLGCKLCTVFKKKLRFFYYYLQIIYLHLEVIILLFFLDNYKFYIISFDKFVSVDYTSNPAHTAFSSAVICGSRAHLEKEETAKRSYFRLFLMHGFHFLVWLLCVKDIRDTQCGFKLLTRTSARTIFEALHVERWAFDVEMLYIAQTLNIPITEIAVNWTEIEGSKIIPFWSWLQMGIDLFLIWLRYSIGAWKINKPKI